MFPPREYSLGRAGVMAVKHTEGEGWTREGGVTLGHKSSPTTEGDGGGPMAATRAPVRSFRTAAEPGRSTFRIERRSTTPPAAGGEPASSTSSPG